jgi:hypothetical protein
VQQPKVPPGFRVYESGTTVNGWHQPLPLVGQVEREPYPVDALPDAIRAVVEEVQAEVQAPAEMVASSALAVASLPLSQWQTLPAPRRCPDLVRCTS